MLDKCERGNKIAPLHYKGVHFYCPSRTNPAIPYNTQSTKLRPFRISEAIYTCVAVMTTLPLGDQLVQVQVSIGVTTSPFSNWFFSSVSRPQIWAGTSQGGLKVVTAGLTLVMSSNLIAGMTKFRVRPIQFRYRPIYWYRSIYQFNR